MNKNVFVAAFEKQLLNYPKKEQALQNISERLDYIENALVGVAAANTTAFNSGGSDYSAIENKRLNLISEKKKLSEQLKKVEFEYLEVKKALGYLDEKDIEIITMRYFYGWKIERIEKHKFLSRSAVYRCIENALLKMVEGLYGNVN